MRTQPSPSIDLAKRDGTSGSGSGTNGELGPDHSGGGLQVQGYPPTP